jgi:hypothetical protein
MLVVRAVRWWRDLTKLGVKLPLFVVHDLGMLYGAPSEQTEFAARPGADEVIARTPRLGELVADYRGVVAEVARSHAATRARSMRLSDDLVVVVLARVLSPLMQRAPKRLPWPTTLPLDLEIVRDLGQQLVPLFSAMPRSYELAVLQAISRARLHVLTLADALDLDTLRLLGMLGPESSTGAGALAQVDLLAALSSPASNDIVNFSLELLPSVLETTRARGTWARSTRWC